MMPAVGVLFLLWAGPLVAQAPKLMDGMPLTNPSAVLRENDERVARGLIDRLNSDSPLIRQRALDDLVAIADADASLYPWIIQNRPKGLTTEQRLLLEQFECLAAPRITWEEARWRVFLAAKTSSITRELQRVVREILSKLTSEGRESLLQSENK